MNFQQLRVIRETAHHNYNLTEAANALLTSQSGISKHIKDLEDELGVELFVRRGKRFLGLTDPGKELLEIVERILLDTRNIKQIGEQFSNRNHGQLTIAATHTQARYTLPSVVAEFKRIFPQVQLVMHQASPTEIAVMVRSGEADIGIATEALAEVRDFAAFPYHRWHHGVIVPLGHPLEGVRPLSLEAIAEWPLITYTEGFTGRVKIDRAFAKANLVPNIVMTALDADVIKTYVELGLGVGIVAAMAFNSERDGRIQLLESSNLFESNTSVIAIQRGIYLRGYAYRFIELCSPALTESVVRSSGAVGLSAEH